MLCHSCGVVNPDDASYCVTCGFSLVSDISCPFCATRNDERAALCRSCGKPIAAEAAVFSGGGRAKQQFFMQPLEIPEERESAPAKPSRESLLAKLDRMEEDFASRLVAQNGVLSTEEEGAPSVSPWDVREDSLVTMSSTLDDLIADLIDAEINEYLTPDFIHPDETGFPQPAPKSEIEADSPKNRKQDFSFVDVLVLIALTIAIFLVGMTVGLWGSQALGL